MVEVLGVLNVPANRAKIEEIIQKNAGNEDEADKKQKIMSESMPVLAAILGAELAKAGFAPGMMGARSPRRAPLPRPPSSRTQATTAARGPRTAAPSTTGPCCAWTQA